jgi:hypothetical protein
MPRRRTSAASARERPTAWSTGEHAREVVDTIRASSAVATIADPDRWSADRPAIGHCDVSSYVARQHLGGDLVPCDVLVDGQRRARHHLNRFADRDVDLSAEQSDGHGTSSRSSS